MRVTYTQFATMAAVSLALTGIVTCSANQSPPKPPVPWRYFEADGICYAQFVGPSNITAVSCSAPPFQPQTAWRYER